MAQPPTPYPTRWRDLALVRGVQRANWPSALRWSDRAGLPLALFALLLGVPLIALLGLGSPNPLIDLPSVSKLGRTCSLAIMAIGLALVWGYAGALSLCQALFFTLGGYAFGMYLCMHGPLDGAGIPRALFVVSSEVSGMTLPWFWKPFDSFWFAVLMVVVVPGTVAFLYGWLAFRSRIRGVYFSILTQAFTFAAWLMFCRNDLLLCGTNGLTNFTHVAGLPLSAPGTKIGLYLASVAGLALAWLCATAIAQSRFGRQLIAIRDAEARLRFLGYHTAWSKAVVFAAGAVFAGVGGALYTPQTGIITPANMMPVESVLVVVWVAIGGRSSITGVVVGTFAIKYLESWMTTTHSVDAASFGGFGATINEMLTYIPKIWLIVIGLFAVLVVLFLPSGLIGAWHRLLARVAPAPSATPAATASPAAPRPSP